jgi:hypothetical protein
VKIKVWMGHQAGINPAEKDQSRIEYHTHTSAEQTDWRVAGWPLESSRLAAGE